MQLTARGFIPTQGRDGTTDNQKKGNPTLTRAEIRTNLHTLSTPRVVTDVHGNTHETRPLIQQIQEMNGETRPHTPGTPSFKSRPPGRVDVMDWITALKDTLGGLSGAATPHTVGLVAACHNVAVDTLEHLGDSAIVDYTAKTEKLVTDANRLAYTELFRVRGQCPKCGETDTGATTDDGHRKTGETLIVYELWAECDSCHYRWEGADIVELARVIAQGERGGMKRLTI